MSAPRTITLRFAAFPDHVYIPASAEMPALAEFAAQRDIDGDWDFWSAGMSQKLAVWKNEEMRAYLCMVDCAYNVRAAVERHNSVVLFCRCVLEHLSGAKQYDWFDMGQGLCYNFQTYYAAANTIKRQKINAAAFLVLTNLPCMFPFDEGVTSYSESALAKTLYKNSNRLDFLHSWAAKELTNEPHEDLPRES